MNNTAQTTVYLLRHGKVNGLPALYGQTDIEVTNEVNNTILVELNELQNNLTNNITQVITSPLQRCKKVAEQFSKTNNIPIEALSAFQEINFGQLDGISFDVIRNSTTNKQTWEQLEDFWREPNIFPLPEAELLTHFYLRVKQAWELLLQKYEGKKILLVCHGGVIRMILSYILNLDHGNKSLFSQLTIENSSVTIIKNIITPSSKYSNVVTISAPLKCVAIHPEEFE
jgi:alpha-ribazole phosphatase